MSIPAQECKAGLPLGLADQERRTGPEIQTPAARAGPSPAVPVAPAPRSPPSHLNSVRLAASCPHLFRLVPGPRSGPSPSREKGFLIRLLSAPQDQN